MMNGGENLDSIPNDLAFQIFSRLPVKSMGRFRCVSKLWRSMLTCSDFTELFLTRTSAHPRLLFIVEGAYEWSFSLSPQPQNPYEKSSLVVAANFHVKFSKNLWPNFSGFTSGLIYFSSNWIWNKDVRRGICNPTTGQYAILPELIKKYRNTHEYNFLGFDPLYKQFKVLSMNIGYNETICHILTLGTGKMSWRKIRCPLTHVPLVEDKGICINGVLYYLAKKKSLESYGIACFDVRSEKFKFIELECFSFSDQLINYKGKLSVMHFSVIVDDVGYVIELRMWVLEDVEKQEWLKYAYTFPETGVFGSHKFSVAGVTARGEIVLSMKYTCRPFYVFYFNPERTTLQRVEIHGSHEMLENMNRVYAFVDYVEDIKFNIVKTTKPTRTKALTH